MADSDNLAGFDVVKPQSRRPGTKWTTAMISQMRELSARGITDKKIGEIMGIDSVAVRNKRISLGISKPKKYSEEQNFSASVPSTAESKAETSIFQKSFTDPMTSALVNVLKSSPDDVRIVIDGKPIAEINGRIIYDKNGDAQRLDIFLLTVKIGGNNDA